MATALRATATNINTTGTNTASIVIPATAQAGDIAVVHLGINSGSITATTPTGWTRQFGPDSTTTANSGYLYYKQLVAGDVGATLNFALTSSVRWSLLIDVISGGTLTGLIAGNTVASSAESSSLVPTLANVPAGAYVNVSIERRIGSGAAIDVTLPSGYTDDGDLAQSTAGSGANFTMVSCHKIPSTLGTVGGETITYNASNPGTVYAVAIPAVAGSGNPTPSGLSGALFIGDSVMEGQGASTKAHRWLDLLVPQLRTLKSKPAGGDGFIPSFWNVYSPDSPWGTYNGAGFTGTLGTADWDGLGYRLTTIQSGGTESFNITGTSIDVWYYRDVTSSGTMAVQVDGVQKVAAFDTRNATKTDATVHVDMGTSGNHVVKILADASNANPVVLLGFTVYNGDETGAYIGYDAAKTGIELSYYITRDGYARWGQSLVGKGIDTVIVNLGTNDYLHNTATASQTQTNTVQILSDLKSKLGTTGIRYIVFVTNVTATPGAGQTDTWANYAAAIKAGAATAGAEVFDMAAQVSLSGTDVTSDGHPNDSGHVKISTAMYNFLAGSPRTGKAKVWTGTQWASHSVKVWTGTAWAAHPAKGWNGSSWILGK